MSKPKHVGRLLFTPSPETRALIDQLHELTGRSRASMVAEMLDTVAPVFFDQVRILKELQDSPEKARELVTQYVNAGHAQITQASIDFDRAIDGRTVKGKRAKTGGLRGGAAK